MLKLDKNKKYILGCSYGPDSMALFYMLLNEGYNFVVCNIDYNYRDLSWWETSSLKDVCEKENIDFYTKNVLFSTKFHNFEAWARNIRYDYFMEIGKKLKIFDIVVAHQQDDLIETYLMQKERGGIVSYYGLNSSYKRNRFTIHRPLLNYTKKDLISYCNKYNIEFCLDPTNFDQTYRRNYFRHSVLPTFSPEERNNLLLEIKLKNLQINEEISNINKLIINNRVFIEEIKNCSFEFIHRLIIIMLNNNGILYEVSKGLINELNKAIAENLRFEWRINDNYVLKIDYEYLSLIDESLNYCLSLNNDIIKIDTSSIDYKKIENINNLCIKPAKLGYFYEISNYKVKINRLFIDWKMPHFIRNIWPAIFDENNNLIYVPRYQSSFKQNKISLMNFDIDEIYSYLENNK